MRKSTHTLKKTFATGTAALIVAGGGAGAAAACHGHDSGTSTSAASFMTLKHESLKNEAALGHDGFRHVFKLGPARSNVVASAVVLYLNLPASTIKTDLLAGQSLAQIATAEGKDPNGLVAAIVAAVKPNLDAAVVNGKLTAAQETTKLADLTTKVTTAVNFQFTAQQHALTHGLKHGFFKHHA